MSSPQPRPRIGISSCLLGDNVRYDGGHKRNESLIETLGSLVEWISVCPEVDIGLGTPRPPIQLERDGEEGIRLVMPETGEDLTDRMARYAIERVDILREKRISGYVLKSKSPSCGMEGVLVYDGNGEASAVDVGIFAAVLRERMPHLPVEDEERLEEADVRENFIVRIFAAARWLELEDAGFTLAGLTRFHAQHRNLVMSHDPIVCETLDQLLRDVENERMVLPELVGQYEQRFNLALSQLPSRQNNTDYL